MDLRVDAAHDRQVDGLVGIAVQHQAAGALGDARLDEGAAADLAAEIAEPLGLLVAHADGLDGDAELAGEVAMGRHAVHGLEDAGVDIGDDALGQRRMLGLSAPLGQPRAPVDAFGDARRGALPDGRTDLTKHEIVSLLKRWIQDIMHGRRPR